MKSIPNELNIMDTIVFLFNFSPRNKQANNMVNIGFVLNIMATVDAFVKLIAS